jgi:hypothetical protein
MIAHNSLPGGSSGRGRSSRWPWLLALAVIVAAVAALWVYWGSSPSQQAQQEKPSPAAATQAPTEQQARVPAPSPQGDTVKVDGSQQSMQEERKKPFGLDKSVDAVARSDEKIQVGDQKIPVEELERKMVVEQRGEVREKSLQGGKVSAWGVHMVRPGDNLWHIHYQLLREYLAGRGIELPPRSDQPVATGKSTGVGKILKFAEHMVGVYNLRTGKMTKDINLLEPGQKVVVFNLSEIFAQLDQVEPTELNGVMYDGRVLFFPKSAKAKPPSQSPPETK